MKPYSLSVWQLMVAGGLMMWPIVLCSVVALAIVVEKVRYLKKAHLDSREFLSLLLEKMKRHQIKEALEFCDHSKTPLSNIVKAGILKYDRSRPQIKEAMEDASLYEVPKLEKGLDMLATIAHISPLLGLLGTTIGLVKVFYGLQAKAAALYPLMQPQVVQGVWEALLTTVAGLIVGTLSLVAYNFFVSRVNNYIIDMETVATELVNFLTEQ